MGNTKTVAVKSEPKEKQPQQKNPKRKVQLSKEEIKAIKKRMSQLENKGKNSVQHFIPFTEMYPDGICHVKGKRYTRIIQFYDINYRLATFEEKNNIFSGYCDLLNYFDNEVDFQLTFENQNIDIDNMIKALEIPEQDDEFNDIRKEYSDMLKSQLLKGTNGKVLKKYITIGLDAENLKSARSRLDSIAAEVIHILRDDMGVAAETLDGIHWLEILYKELNPFSDEPFIFDWGYRAKTGNSTKDFIAPASIKFNKTSFEMGKCHGSVYSINLLAGELSDKILDDYLSNDDMFSINMHVETFDQAEALKFLRGKLTDVKGMKVDEQLKANRAGYDPDILPPSIELYIKEIEKMIDDLQQRNERLFNITLTIRNYAENNKKLKLQQELLKRITQKNACRLVPIEYMQEQALASSLPLGYNAVPINRILTTSAIAIFMPFTTQELFQGNNAAYYGLNSLSNNMILGDRKLLKNPNGLIFGTPGSGKSFAVKREILDSYLKTSDDIFICDAESEYHPLVKHLHGQIIKLSASSKHHINPMDIVWDTEQDEDPISVKCEFLLSLLEIIVGGRFGLTSEERSVADRCISQVYNRFINNNPSVEKMPVLGDLLSEFRAAGEGAERLANSLEIYVTGSQNVFNQRTNVDLNNRVVCFDIKELGNQLRKVGMLIVQDAVWNRVSANRNNKFTRYYIDEFHLLLREEQTAKYMVEMWKRLRKWGGIPTGATQNVKDVLLSPEIENILDNSDFIYMLNQAPGDREILAEKLHISSEQLKFVTNSKQGEGLIFFGDVILPFKDKFPKNTLMYSLMTTNPSDEIGKVPKESIAAKVAVKTVR